ncbi:hypothetical protein GOV08_04820 [Candidatus Woesearchaeota archaeon]|nr:hypothetical protein [Candidatus Woesearchaeota archaeon]
MSIRYYGVQTESGSWYLIEDHTHIFKHSTWFINSNGNKLNINFLLNKNMAHSQGHNWRKALMELPNHPQQVGLYVGHNKGLTPVDQIKSIKDFVGHMIINSEENGSDVMILRKGKFANTNFIKTFIEFK